MSAQNFRFSYSAFDLSLFDMGEGLRLLLDNGRDDWDIPIQARGGGALRAGATADTVVDGVPLAELRVIYTLDLDGDGRTESLFVAQPSLPGFVVSNLRAGDGFPGRGDYDAPVFEGVLGDRASASGDADRATGGRDRLVGDGGRDVIDGKGGDDVLLGKGGADRLGGGKGNDRLDGGGGRDRLNGGAGDDRIDGGKGVDKLAGGAGRDVFHFARGDGKRDVVEDWNRRADQIEIASGAERFAQLKFRDKGDDVLVKYGRDAFVVLDADRKDLRAADFDFV